MGENVQDERTTDSSVGWLNYNKNGPHICSKMSLYEGEKKTKKKKKKRAFDRATTTTTNPKEEKKRTR
jgi:hypothetical protein